ncbi:MAG: transglutaminase N-terminal domain-containing protein [Verrucomicrobium sp.]
MTKFHIIHRTEYRYSEPVRFGLHRLVLRPREGHRTTVLNHTLTLSPKARFFWMNDLYGNHVALAEISEPADRLEIVSEVIMEVMDPRDDEAPMDGSRCSLVNMPVTYPVTEQAVVEGYLRPVYLDERTTVRNWVDQTLSAGAPPTALGVVHFLNRAIHDQIAYRRREEAGIQSPATTLRLLTGSCRDMANLLIEACRTLGIASRFASGYLDTRASTAGIGATHAWTDVYLPDCGWCGFDPTLGQEVSTKHILLGASAHPRGVMPVSGIYSGPPGCYLGMKVNVSIQREVVTTPAEVEPLVI